MITIAKLKKPYTQLEKNEFIIEYNRENNYLIEETETELIALDYTKEEKAKIREEAFRKIFIEIPGIENNANFSGGWYRKIPQGYSNAVESMNSALNIVSIIGMLPAKTLVFYNKPDFTKENQCTEEWLKMCAFYNKQMTENEFKELYVNFMSIWNAEEHNLNYQG